MNYSYYNHIILGKQGFNFYGKPLKIQYAKTKSNIISNKELQEEGTIGKKRKNNNNDRDDGNELRSRKEENDEDNNNIQLQTSYQHILVAKDLPLNITQDALTILFQQCRGFKEVRKPDGRNIAFIEFYDPIEASMALKQFNGFILNSTTNETLLLSFSQ
jgi:U2 small nuclear ribonucleoprotein B''